MASQDPKDAGARRFASSSPERSHPDSPGMKREGKISRIQRNLEALEQGADPEKRWLPELVRARLSGASDPLLDFFLELTDQEKSFLSDWFRAPDEREEKTVEIRQYAGALKEYGADLARITLEAAGRLERISDLLPGLEGLEPELLDQLHSRLGQEVKRKEIEGQVRMLEKMADWGSEGSPPFPAGEDGGKEEESAADEDEIGTFPEFEMLEKKIQEIGERKTIPDYLRIEVYNPATFLEKVPRIVDPGGLRDFLLAPHEKTTLDLVDGCCNVRQIVSSSPLRYDAINLLIYFRLRKILEW